MTCTHQFIKVEEARMQGTAGAVVVCALCGEVRRIYANGKVITLNIGEKQYTWNGEPCTKEEYEAHMK